MQNKDHVIVNRSSTKHSKKSTRNTYRSDTGQVQKSASGKKEQHMLQINLQHTILQTAWAQRLERLYKTTGRENMHEKYTEKKHRTLKRHDFYQSRPRKNRQIKKNLVRPSLQRLRMSIGLFGQEIFLVSSPGIGVILSNFAPKIHGPATLFSCRRSSGSEQLSVETTSFQAQPSMTQVFFSE